MLVPPRSIPILYMILFVPFSKCVCAGSDYVCFVEDVLAVAVHSKLAEQVLGSVVAHLLLAVVHCRNLQNNGKVSAGAHGDGEHRHLYSENSCIVIIYTHTVVGLFGVPQLHLNYHVDFFCELYCAHTEKLPCINYTYAAQLKKMTDIIRGATNQCNIGGFLYLYCVIGNKTMSALY